MLFKDEGHALHAHCGNCSHLRLPISQIKSAGVTRLTIETLKPKRWDAVRDFLQGLLLAALEYSRCVAVGLLVASFLVALEK